MISRVLVPLGPSQYTETAIKVGCAVAANHNAVLTGLVVLDIPGIKNYIVPPPIGTKYVEDMEEKKIAEVRGKMESLLEKFKRTCSDAGIEFNTMQLEGSPSKTILKESLYYDAVIMGLRSYYHFESSKYGDSLEDLLDHSSTPVYAVPKTVKVPDFPRDKFKALICFDGSTPAARTLQRFAQLIIPETCEIKILTSHEDSKTAEYYLDRSEGYLNAHGFNNVQKEWTLAEIEDEVEKKYMDWADLIVIGAHSKKGILDFMLGSLSTHLIKLDKKPLFIGQ